MTAQQIQERFAKVCEEAPRLRGLGYSVSSIASRFDVSQSSVYRALKLHEQAAAMRARRGA